MCKTVLLIAHTPSPNTMALANAAIEAVASADTGNVIMQLMSPFDVRTPDVNDAAAVIIGTTENIGYMAGATKDMFDRCYNDWFESAAAKPAPLVTRGAWQDDFCTEVSELCLGVAIGIDSGIY
ncbi:hypothetical protein N9X93_06355 [Alphaproteobacteria bacterium]|nr:hypothetical protein [Alphaproteobacteria bacterium]